VGALVGLVAFVVDDVGRGGVEGKHLALAVGAGSANFDGLPTRPTAQMSQPMMPAGLTRLLGIASLGLGFLHCFREA
jgi:hypothetical protein